MDKTSIEREALAELVGEAINRAWRLGQTYWQQADSESYRENARSDVTRGKYEDLRTQTLALLAQQPEAVGAQTAPQGQAGADAVDAKRYRWLRENCLDWEVDGEHRWGALHFDNSSGREGIFADAPESLDAAIDALLPQPPKDQEA
jgi:hypothetical protein